MYFILGKFESCIVFNNITITKNCDKIKLDIQRETFLRNQRKGLQFFTCYDTNLFNCYNFVFTHVSLGGLTDVDYKMHRIWPRAKLLSWSNY